MRQHDYYQYLRTVRNIYRDALLAEHMALSRTLLFHYNLQELGSMPFALRPTGATRGNADLMASYNNDPWARLIINTPLEGTELKKERLRQMLLAAQHHVKLQRKINDKVDDETLVEIMKPARENKPP